MIMMQNRAKRRAMALGLGACVAVDAGCLAVSGLAGLVAFGFAWVVLKTSGII
jgi:hypothetical protein